ncbi:MAG: right-handed parallel beta-helix repeat-containing protein, partial [Ferruginibacter sp.]
NYAYNNSVCVFKLTNCKNVLLKNITLYGEVDKMKKQDGVVEGENYGVYIADDEEGDASSNIVLQNITAHHFAADGFVIKSNGENIEMNKCYSYNNARQGLSIVKGRNIKCLNSVFDSTGFTGAYGWHAPGAGIDVENEFGWGKLTNVLIQNCTLRGNKGFQIVTTLPSEKVVIDSCFISDLTAGYSDGLNGVGMYSLNSVLSNSILFATIQVDIADQIYTGPVIQEFKKNIIYSGHRGITSASFSRPANVLDNIFIMLPNPQLDTYFPYIQNGNCRFNRNIIVVHADRIKKEPNQVTALVQGVLEASDDFWLMNGYEIPKNKRKATYYIPALNGTKSLQKHFFPKNDKIDALNFSQKKALSETQVDKILSAELFIAYKQRSFNRKFLIQADVVRKYSASIVASVKE